MCKKSLAMLIFLPVALALLAFASGGIRADASADDDGGGDPVGAYSLTLTPADFPPFQELLTFHENGTVSETNTALHANSANPFFPFNGSDGYGAWSDGPDDTVAFEFVKLVFDGETNAHVGYLVVDGHAVIEGDDFTSLAGVNILFGPDLCNPLDVMPLGEEEATGKRITVAGGDDDDDDDDD